MDDVSKRGGAPPTYAWAVSLDALTWLDLDVRALRARRLLASLRDAWELGRQEKAPTGGGGAAVPTALAIPVADQVQAAQVELVRELVHRMNDAFWEYPVPMTSELELYQVGARPCRWCRNRISDEIEYRHRLLADLTVAGEHCARCGETGWWAGVGRPSFTHHTPPEQIHTGRRGPARITSTVRSTDSATIQGVSAFTFSEGPVQRLSTVVVEEREIAPGESVRLDISVKMDDPLLKADQHQAYFVHCYAGQLAVVPTHLDVWAPATSSDAVGRVRGVRTEGANA